MALLFVPPWCLGAEFPMRAVRLIAPFPPGGPTDVLARTLAGQLTQRWKQQVVVDNRPGAAGNIGAELAARATPDGHTLLMGTVATHAINESLYRQLPYSPHKDFAAVALAAQTPSAIVVHPSVAARSLPEFLALARARGAAINYAHAGVGTIAHLAVELLRMQTGVVVTSVAYKGTSPAINDTIAGQTHFMITSTLTVQPFVKSGRLRALAVTSPRRSKAFPDLPTAIEAGLPNYVVLGWAGVFAPARVPRVLIDRINTAINEGLADAVTLERLLASGSEPSAMSAAEFTRFTQAEAARWAGVVKEARISPE
jgi:tripartite-type tricarboxylate transporter receptor subunit TctC